MKILPLNNYKTNGLQQNKKVTFEARTNANLSLNTLSANPFLHVITGGIGDGLSSEVLALREAIGDTGDISAELRVVEGLLSKMGIEPKQKPPKK